MIVCKKSVTVRKVEKKCLQRRPVHKNWRERLGTVQSCKLKPAHMSSTVRKIVEQRILTNLAISRARASIRAAKFEKSRTEAQQAKVELGEIRLSELDRSVSSKGSRRPPNPLMVYKKYLEKCKPASQAKAKQLGQESSSRSLAPVVQFPNAESGPSSLLNQPKMTSEHTLKYQDTHDQSGSSKVSDCSDDHVFKKPFPVKQKAPRHKTTIKEGGKKRVKIQNKKNKAFMKTSAIRRKFLPVRYLHPSVLEKQNKDAARVMKLMLEKGHLQRKKENVRKKQTVDLFETLHKIVLLICDQVSLKRNCYPFGCSKDAAVGNS